MDGIINHKVFCDRIVSSEIDPDFSEEIEIEISSASFFGGKKVCICVDGKEIFLSVVDAQQISGAIDLAIKEIEGEF